MSIYSNRSIIVLFVLALVMFLPFYKASAQVSFETVEATFDTNNPGLNVQDFQVVNAPTGSVISCGTSPINLTTNNTCFSPGEILAGIEFFADPGDLLVLGDSLSASNNPANVLVNSTFVDLLEIGFIGTTDAVGLTLGCVATGFATCAETIVVSVFGETDNLIGSTNVAVTDSVDAFIGIESLVPIGRISMDFLVLGGSVVKAIHEVKFNSPPVG
ncbi:MAG: hypothetical protein WBB48_02370 [Thermodesulfobacteriota bacterium]